MTWDVIETKWKQFEAKVQDYWCRLTDADLQAVAGRRDRLSRLLQKRYGLAREAAERQIDAFLARKKTASRI